MLHDDAGVELDIGAQVATGLQLVQQLDDASLDQQCQLHHRARRVAAQIAGDIAQHQRTWVVGPVDGMSEAHDHLAGLDLRPHNGIDCRNGVGEVQSRRAADLVQ